VNSAAAAAFNRVVSLPISFSSSYSFRVVFDGSQGCKHVHF
jgi:hypothetical protein